MTEDHTYPLKQIGELSKAHSKTLSELLGYIERQSLHFTHSEIRVIFANIYSDTLTMLHVCAVLMNCVKDEKREVPNAGS